MPSGLYAKDARPQFKVSKLVNEGFYNVECREKKY